MLCPFCQRPVGAFTKSNDGRTLRCPLADCPGADSDVPNLYTRDYDAHPPVALSILGPTGHGKTMFIEALLTHLEQHVRWPEFSTQWMDEVGMREIRERLRALRHSGRVADGTTSSVFTRPKILRLRGIPRFGGRQLLMYDTSGESFATAEKVLEYGRFVRNSPAILWVVSLTDLEYPEQLGDLTTSYAHAMDQMGADPREQAMVVVLSKGDKFLGPPRPGEERHVTLPELPAAAREFLENDDLDPAGDGLARLDAVHEALDGWLQQTRLRGTVNLLKAQFRTVKFTIVSAQGSEAVDDTLKMDLMPRGILAPLLWLLRVGKPSVWVETKAGRELHLDLAAAIDAAPDGATVRLERGAVTLDAPVNLGKSLTIVGSGVDSCRVVSTAEKYAFGLAGNAVTFRGLTLTHAGGAPADVLRVKRGVLTLTDVEVRGGVAGGGVPGDGVLALGPCELHLSGVRLTENAGAGLGLRDPLCKATLKDCKVTRNGGVGVSMVAGACTLAASTLAHNGRGGVEILKGGTLEIDGGTLTSNGKFGVRSAAASGGSVTLKGVTVEAHADRGIDLHGTVTLSASNVTCRGNKSSGVNLKDECAATIRGGTFTGNTYGVVAAGASRCQVSGATVSGNSDSGVLFAEQAQGTCLGNTCTGNGNGGLRVFGTARVSHRGNTFKDNAGGDVVAGPDAAVSVAPDPAAPPPPPPAAPAAVPKKSRGWFG